MSKDTVPVFMIGTGRSGTRSMFKMLTGVEDVEIYHEFVCTHVQKLATLYYMGLIDKEQTKRELLDLHVSAIHYSDVRLWIDTSNKLSWLIEPLRELLPNARFLNIVRDGRKVAASFFFKLNEEMYDDRSVGTMQDWLANRDTLPVPPPEKKYWWNIPQAGQPFHQEFSGFDQFQRVCYHWQECNRFIIEKLAAVPEELKLTVKLEDMVKDQDVLRQVISFVGLEYNREFFECLQTPQNVFFPMNFNLTDSQLGAFDAICHPMMEHYGYHGTDVYEVKY